MRLHTTRFVPLRATILLIGALLISTASALAQGSGSATPKPRIPRLASVKIKTGTEIQNCAYKTGFRLGTR